MAPTALSFPISRSPSPFPLRLLCQPQADTFSLTGTAAHSLNAVEQAQQRLLGRWVYFEIPPVKSHKLGASSRQAPLGPAKTIAHNIHLITGCSWPFWIRSLCSFGAGIYWIFYGFQGGKEEAFALYGAAFTRCSFCATFLLLAMLSPINPERAPRERLRDGSR